VDRVWLYPVPASTRQVVIGDVGGPPDKARLHFFRRGPSVVCAHQHLYWNTREPVHHSSVWHVLAAPAGSPHRKALQEVHVAISEPAWCM